MKSKYTGFGLIQLLAIVAIVGVLAGVCMPSAKAQQYTVSTLSLGTNVIAASGTLSPTNAVATATKNNNVGYTVSFRLSGTGVANVVSFWAKGIDGTYESTPSITMTNAANGTNTVVGFGNTALGGASHLKLVKIENANTPSTVAGLEVKAAVKPEN